MDSLKLQQLNGIRSVGMAWQKPEHDIMRTIGHCRANVEFCSLEYGFGEHGLQHSDSVSCSTLNDAFVEKCKFFGVVPEAWGCVMFYDKRRYWTAFCVKEEESSWEFKTIVIQK